MKTAFSRQLALTAGMILLSFVLLGCSFTSLFYSYMLRNEKMSLSTNAEAVAGSGDGFGRCHARILGGVLRQTL